MHLKNQQVVLSFFLLAILLHSCVSWKKLEQSIKNERQPQTFSSLRFYNYSITDSVKTTYPNYSFFDLNKKMRLSKKDTLVNWRKTIVQLDSLKNALSVSFYREDTLVEQYLMKGKWKNNFFYVSRSSKAIGIPPLFFFYDEKLRVIGNYGSELVFFQLKLKAGMILFISGGGKDYNRESYQTL